MRRAGVRCTVALGLTAVLCGCGDGVAWCVDRGSRSAYGGSMQYAGQVADTSGALQMTSGATPVTLTIDDLSAQGQSNGSDPGYCGAQFTVRVSDSCVLWGTPKEFRYDTGKNASGDFISAEVDLAADGACTLALQEGSVVVGVRGGSLSLTPGHAEVTFDGTVQTLNGASRSGYLSVMYASE